jgi:hypothetical protein
MKLNRHHSNLELGANERLKRENARRREQKQFVFSTPLKKEAFRQTYDRRNNSSTKDIPKGKYK